MRTTQFIGHTLEVDQFLQSLESIKTKNKVYGMFGEEICSLYRYLDKNGSRWEEFEQYCPWSSGPVIFLGIRNLDTGEIRGWKERYIEGRGEYIDYQNGEFWI